VRLKDVEQAIIDLKVRIASDTALLETFEKLRLQLASDRTNIVRNMQPTETVRPRRARRGRPPRGSHPFTHALDARGSSLAEWARKHREEPEVVRGWVREVDGRRIPRETAEAIEREMGVDEKGRPRVPATLATWKNGIR
jgi:hypothetical protein